MTAGSADYVKCGRPMHKACSCCRPTGHTGPCNCVHPTPDPPEQPRAGSADYVNLDDPLSPKCPDCGGGIGLELAFEHTEVAPGVWSVVLRRQFCRSCPWVGEWSP